MMRYFKNNIFKWLTVENKFRHLNRKVVHLNHWLSLFWTICHILNCFINCLDWRNVPRFNAPLNILMAICISRWWIHYWRGSGKSRKIIVAKQLKHYFLTFKINGAVIWLDESSSRERRDLFSDYIMTFFSGISEMREQLKI